MASSPEARARVRQILGDAKDAVPAVASLAVYDAEGMFVGSAGWGIESDLSEEMAELLDPAQGVVYQRVLSPEHEHFRVAYAAALTSDGTPQGDLVGVLQVRFNPGPLARPSRHLEGLGATGEVIIAVRDADGAVRIPRRAGPSSSASRNPGCQRIRSGRSCRLPGIPRLSSTAFWNRVRRQDYFYPDRARVFPENRAHIEKRLGRLRKKQA